MPYPTPHVENSKVDGGDRVNPVITDITKGGQWFFIIFLHKKYLDNNSILGEIKSKSESDKK